MRRLLVALLLMALLCAAFATATAKSAPELIRELSSPAGVASYQSSLPGTLGFLFAPNTNYYVRRSSGSIETYHMQSVPGGVALRRGRASSPPTEIQVSEQALNSVLRAGAIEACVADNYLQRGQIIVSGTGSRRAVFAIKLACLVQRLGSGPSSITLNGKRYYKVIPGDTGTIVCQRAGLNCVAMTPSRDPSVCQAFHPGAATQDIIHGSQFYWWCNGQDSLVCAQQGNVCKVCTACNPNIGCNDDPRDAWGNEIYVECGAGGSAPRTPPATPPPPACNSQRLGDRCGPGACGAGTNGQCVRGTLCNTATQRCTTVLPTPRVIENGDRCEQDSQCQSGRCVYDPYMDMDVCDGPRDPGKLCGHGGQCRSDLHCLYYAGEGPDRHNRCSCKMFVHDTNC